MMRRRRLSLLVIIGGDPLNTQHAQHREEVVFTRESAGGGGGGGGLRRRRRRRRRVRALGLEPGMSRPRRSAGTRACRTFHQVRVGGGVAMLQARAHDHTTTRPHDHTPRTRHTRNLSRPRARGWPLHHSLRLRSSRCSPASRRGVRMGDSGARAGGYSGAGAGARAGVSRAGGEGRR